MRCRLSRLDRIYEECLFYFLTFCTHDRKKLLDNPSVHHSFQTFGRQVLARNIFVGRYVLMPDHVHLFVAFQEQDQMAMWMKSLKNCLSKTLREMGHPAPHWQKGYFDHLMRHEESYESKWLYVGENPVRKGFVTDSKDWPYLGELESLRFD